MNATSLNALAPIEVIPAGNEISVSEVPANALAPIVVRPSGRAIAVSGTFSNAFAPIDVSPAGSVIAVNTLFLNIPCGIDRSHRSNVARKPQDYRRNRVQRYSDHFDRHSEEESGTIERACPDRGDSARDSESGILGHLPVSERRVGNLRHRRGEGNIGEFRTVIERVCVDIFDTAKVERTSLVCRNGNKFRARFVVKHSVFNAELRRAFVDLILFDRAVRKPCGIERSEALRELERLDRRILEELRGERGHRIGNGYVCKIRAVVKYARNVRRNRTLERNADKIRTT